jgi:ribosome-associated protein
VLLDIRPVTVVADYFVVCNGTSERQLATLSSRITETIKQESGRGPLRIEGEAGSGWVLIDYGDVVVHLFSPAERDYYQLEDVWSGSVPLVRIE